MTAFETEVEFILPRGYVDAHGNVHRHGRMRLATLLDEIAPQNHPAVQENEAYMVVLLMARVITQLGQLTAVTPQVVEGLFTADIAYLEDLYLRLNSAERLVMGTACPHCRSQFQVEVAPLAG